MLFVLFPIGITAFAIYFLMIVLQYIYIYKSAFNSPHNSPNFFVAADVNLSPCTGLFWGLYSEQERINDWVNASCSDWGSSLGECSWFAALTLHCWLERLCVLLSAFISLITINRLCVCVFWLCALCTFLITATREFTSNPSVLSQILQPESRRQLTDELTNKTAIQVSLSCCCFFFLCKKYTINLIMIIMIIIMIIIIISSSNSGGGGGNNAVNKKTNNTTSNNHHHHNNHNNTFLHQKYFLYLDLLLLLIYENL